MKARSLQPFPLEKLWDAERIDGIVGVPWNPVGTAQRQAAENQEPHRPEADIDGEQQQGPGPNRGMPVLAKHLEKFGYTDNCRKCRKLRMGDVSQPGMGHSAECKARIREQALRHAEFSAQAQAGLN